MLDLTTEAVAGWLAVHGSEELARSPPRADDQAELASEVVPSVRTGLRLG